MKNVTTIGLIVLALVIIIYIIFLNECRRPEPCPPKGQVLVSQVLWDSLKNQKPTTDTVWIHDTIKIPNPKPPLPIPQPDTTNTDTNFVINVYNDSLIAKDINVWIKDTIKGELLSRNWQYRPITFIVTKVRLVPIEIPINKPHPVETPKNHLYFDIIYGTEFKHLWSLPGLGLNFTSKKDFEIGYMFQRTQEAYYHSIKLGMRLF